MPTSDESLILDAIFLHNFVSRFFCWKRRTLLGKVLYDADFLEMMEPERHDVAKKSLLNRFSSLWLRLIGDCSLELKKFLLILLESKFLV